MKRFVTTSDMDVGYTSHLIVLARWGLILNASKNIPLSRNVSNNSQVAIIGDIVDLTINRLNSTDFIWANKVVEQMQRHERYRNKLCNSTNMLTGPQIGVSVGEVECKDIGNFARCQRMLS
jgi:hypothetical protein